MCVCVCVCVSVCVCVIENCKHVNCDLTVVQQLSTSALSSHTCAQLTNTPVANTNNGLHWHNVKGSHTNII